MRRGAVAVAVGLLVGVGAPTAAQDRPPLVPPPASGATTVPDGWPTAPAVTADAYLLVDAATGQTLAERAADERRRVASTVKILTAISVLTRADLDDRVTVGEEVAGFAADAAGVGLQPGDPWTVEDLLEGLVARSGNDAAAALAVAIGGSVPRFAGLMARDAAALGVEGVVLTSPTGLDDGNRLSARDLATLARAALADGRFAAIAARPVVELPGLGAVRSRNGLLSTYPGAYGVKTGFTAAAGRTLVAAAARDGRRLVAVVLGSDGPTDHFADARALLDFGFGALRAAPVAGAGAELEVKVPGGWVAYDAGDATVHVPVGEEPSISAEPPTEAGERAAPVVARWSRTDLLELELSTEGRPRPPTEPAAWLVDRVYAAMRAATVADAWAAVGAP